MHKRLLLAVLIPAFAVSASVSAQTVVDPNLAVSAVVPNGTLAEPTQMRFLGPNDLLVTEKSTGRVRRITNGSLSPTIVIDLAVANDDERGLLGITLDPAFATNNRVYLYYSATSGGDGGPWVENRLSRFVWNGSTLGSETILATFGSASDGQATGPNHDAGPISFGPDGLLYGTTGDLNRNVAEQNNTSAPNSSSFVGAIYRLTATGAIPATNPFAGNANPDFRRLFGYGVRNTYGIAFDPLTGNLWDTENGPNDNDEINLVAAGFNSGWNKIMGLDSRDPQNVSDLVMLPGASYSDPEFSFLTPIAVTGLAFLANTSFGASYQDALLVGNANLGQLHLFRLNANRTGFVLTGGLADLVADSPTERDTVRFGQGFGPITDIRVGPDANVYVMSIGNGTIYKILPEPPAALSLLVGALAVALGKRARSLRAQ